MDSASAFTWGVIESENVVRGNGTLEALKNLALLLSLVRFSSQCFAGKKLQLRCKAFSKLWQAANKRRDRCRCEAHLEKFTSQEKTPQKI